MTLREARTKRNLTQEELAARSGVEQPTISALENSRIQSPSWDTVCLLARALKVKPEELFPVPDRTEVAQS